MESWSYGSEAKGFMYAGESELISHSDSLGSRKVVTDWDLKTPSFDIESPMSVSGRTVIQVRRVENQGFMELDFRNREEVIGKSLSENPIGVPGVPCNRIGNGRISSFLMGPKVFYGEMEESGSGILSCVTDSNSRESLIDLKLGRLSDSRDGKNLKETSFMSSVVSSNTAPAKRARLVHSNNQTPLCQVHGCNLDLSSSKDYHKRHKVCAIHSKAAKVVVNGLEQRFCQQCSRFHLLVEFDEGKRSCRKRLSGHNERRRKHQMDTHYGKFRKLLSTYNGDNPPATSFLPRTCFICPEIYSSGVLREVKYGNSNGCRTVNLEEEPIYNGELRIPNTNRFLFPTSSFPTHTVENLFPGLQEINSTGGSLCCETSNQYVRTFLNQNSSFNASSSIEGLSGVSNPGCALSLLSSQSWDPSTQSSGLPVAQPLMVQGGHPHYNTGLFPEKLLELAGSSQASTSVGSTRFSSSGMNSVGDDQLGPMLVSDASDAIDLEVKADGLFQNSNLANTKDVISQKGEHTLDLLHLSSQLQNVENHPRQAKLGNEIFLWNLVAQ